MVFPLGCLSVSFLRQPQDLVRPVFNEAAETSVSLPQSQIHFQTTLLLMRLLVGSIAVSLPKTFSLRSSKRSFLFGQVFLLQQVVSPFIKPYPYFETICPQSH